MTKQKRDIHQEITDRIIVEMEKAVSWEKPWNPAQSANGFPANYRTKNQYSGINVLVLWDEQSKRGYEHPYWLTFRQAQELGGQVRKGEKGTAIVFYKQIQVDDRENEGEKKSIPMLKHFTVFNIDQIDGLTRPESAPAPVELPERIAAIDVLTDSYGVPISHGGARAFYSPGNDQIQIPTQESFTSTENYYATLLHELTHSTGHKSRLDRLGGSNRFGDAAYAKEELVAELGAAFLGAQFGITGQLENHAAYLKSWLEALKGDKKYIFQAAAAASKAVQHLDQFTGNAEEEEPAEAA